MIFKKAGGKIFGVEFSKSEQKAVDQEILNQIADMNEDNSIEMDATILWVLHEEFGFGETRLKRFYSRYLEEMDRLNERYRDENCDFVFENTRKLANYGVDISDWSEKND